MLCNTTESIWDNDSSCTCSYTVSWWCGTCRHHFRRWHPEGNHMGRCLSVATITEFLKWSVAGRMGGTDGCRGVRTVSMVAGVRAMTVRRPVDKQKEWLMARRTHRRSYMDLSSTGTRLGPPFPTAADRTHTKPDQTTATAPCTSTC